MVGGAISANFLICLGLGGQMGPRSKKHFKMGPENQPKGLHVEGRTFYQEFDPEGLKTNPQP